MRVNARDLRLNEADAAVEHRPAQVVGDVVGLTPAEGQPHERRVEDEAPFTRDERNLMLRPERLRQRFGRHHAAEAASEYENVCHFRTPSIVNRES